MHFAQTEINMNSFLFTDETKIRSSSKTLKKNDKKINLSFCKTILDSCGLLDEPIKSLNSKYQYGINIITNTFIHTLTSTHTLLVTVYRSIGVQESSVRYLKTINNLLTRHTKECDIRKKHVAMTRTHLKATRHGYSYSYLTHK